MPILPIVVVPHDSLGTQAEEIENIDDHIIRLAKNMAETMYVAPGIGIAANQVNEQLRLIVVDVEYACLEPAERKKKPVFIINPVISLYEGENIMEEGCLSVPDFGVDIARPEIIQVRGVDLDGNPIKIETDGLLARALQHEIDHLDGTTILDHASTLRRSIYKRKLKKKAKKEQ
ncbi:peptide deformylase [Thermodesulfobacteriota bacterium]